MTVTCGKRYVGRGTPPKKNGALANMLDLMYECNRVSDSCVHLHFEAFLLHWVQIYQGVLQSLVKASKPGESNLHCQSLYWDSCLGNGDFACCELQNGIDPNCWIVLAWEESTSEIRTDLVLAFTIRFAISILDCRKLLQCGIQCALLPLLDCHSIKSK